MKLVELAEKTSCIIEQGSPEIEISSTAGLDLAGSGDVTFLANPKYFPQLSETKASAVFLNVGVDIGRGDIAVLRAPDAYVAYTEAMRLFFPEPKLVPAIHSSANIDPSAEVDDTVEIHANA